jgi:bifunctional UDP-N-acetylglucosamine pyrophosphorylase/glucosamine-1-phosphate N-acetyltransferase
MTLSIVILAAGHGKRMQSALPKALHTIGGIPMLAHVLKTTKALKPDSLIVVYGYLGEAIQETFQHEPLIRWVKQTKQLGTGHALQTAINYFPQTGHVLVLYADVPCIYEETLHQLLTKAEAINGVALLVDQPENPNGMGRIIRNEAGEIIEIIEESDATPEQKAIQETNTGIMVLPAKYLVRWLSTLASDNTQNEYYLTDTIKLAVRDKIAISSLLVKPSWQAMGINTHSQKITLERFFQKKQADYLIKQDVTIIDPNRFDLRGEIHCGKDVTIDVNCIIEGYVVLADHVYVGAHCVLKDTIIGEGTTIKPFSHIDGAKIGQQVTVGPYARLRPGTQLDDNVHVGNFIEIKNSTLASHSKANHLGYLGDATIGSHVNIGAGTVTCNYDGANKFRTTIEKGAFIGSGTMLVAPIQIAQNATIGAGSVITQDAPANALTLARSYQITLPSWQKPKKQDDIKQ